MLHKLKPSKTNILIGGSIATTVASFAGSLPYFQNEIGNTPMAVTAVGVMSMGIYFGWDSFLSHKKISVKAISASIALSFSLLSSYSIYQNTVLPKIEAEKANQERLIQSRENAVSLQKKIIREDVSRLIKINSEDRRQKRAFEKKSANHPKFKATRDSLAKSISLLNADILRREKQISTKTKRLDEILSAKKFTPKVNKSQTSWENNLPTLARSSIYDAMTFLLLLMAGFYKKESNRKEEEQAEEVLTKANKAKKELKTAITIAEKQSKKTNSSNCDVTIDITIEDFYLLLEKEQIKTSARDLLTPANVAEATGKGLPTAKKWLNQASKDGLIKSWGNRRGVNYAYLNKQEKLEKEFKEAQMNCDSQPKLTVVGV